MTIYATCGHVVTMETEVILSLKDISYGDENNDTHPVISFGTYCQSCADEYERDGWVLHNDAEEEAYRRSGKSEWRAL